MERLGGRAFHDAALPGLTPPERRGIYLSMAETMAKLHAVDPASIGLADYGLPGNYFERQIARWTKQWQEFDGEPIPEIDALVAWLPKHLPPDDGRVSIAHGDLRLGNFFIHRPSPRHRHPRLGVVDARSSLGRPRLLLDALAHEPLRVWRRARPRSRSARHSLRAEFTAHYYEHAAPTAPIGPFHVAFALFRFAVIFVGIRDRFAKGNAAGKNAAEVGPLAKRFAIRGLEVSGGA